jgi:FtsP/CotA-like multicopper oxidase with cupredoxin domain
MLGAGAAVTPLGFARAQGQRAPATPAASAPARTLARTITLGPARARLRPNPAPEIDVLGFDGVSPGRPLRLKQGEPVALTINNATDEPLGLHWHGMRIPAEMDGVAGFSQAPIAPGASHLYQFTPPDSGVFLARAATLGRSGVLQERGLAAAVIVDEPSPPTVDADITLVIDDWLLTEDNTMAPFEPGLAAAAAGRLGSWLTVNGRVPPERATLPQGGRFRLRIVSACNARIMRLRFEGMRPFVIAVDGQPTDSFEPLRASLPVAPGSRYDLLVDVPPEPTAVFTVVAQVGPGIPLFMLSATERRVTRPALPPIAPPPPNPLLPPMIRLQDSLRAEMVIEGGARAGADGKLDPASFDAQRPWTVNGAVGALSAKPLFSVARGRPVTVALNNRTAWTQVLHVHGHSFRLLHPLDDGWEPYWLDTVQVPESRTLRIAFAADNPGRWLISSGVLERFDAGLWTWFEVT